MKKVSLVLPTRNRAHLLRYALRSAVAQTYRPLEIIVCDNCSADGTRQVVDALKTENVVYVRPGRVLAMPDNWEFALGHATGDYVTFLPDDSYLVRSAVSTAVEEEQRHKTRVVVWGSCSYFSPDWLETGRRNMVWIPKMTGKTVLVESAAALARLYANEKVIHTIIPKGLNSLVHRSLIGQVINTQKRFFLPPCPDYAAAVGVLATVPHYALIDLPLLLDGVTPSSIGVASHFNMGHSVQEFVKEFEGGLADVGYRGILTTSASIARTLEDMAVLYPNTGLRVDQDVWLPAIVDELTRIEANGGEVGPAWARVREQVKKRGTWARVGVEASRISSKAKWRLLTRIRASRALEILEILRGHFVLGRLEMRGHAAGFTDIESCARIVEERIAVLRRAHPPTAPSDGPSPYGSDAAGTGDPSNVTRRSPSTVRSSTNRNLQGP